jgi:DNA replication protein DnaC
LARRLRSARLKEKGVVEDIDYQHPRGLDRKLLRALATSEWVRQHQHILLLGPTGIGKTWLACALAQKACRDGFTILHKRAAELFRELAVAHVDGSFGRLLSKLSRIDILVLDDFAMAPLKDSERRDFLEICDDRYQRRSLILTSQMPLAHWHEQIGDVTVADSILDRVVHNAPPRTQRRVDAQKARAQTGGGSMSPFSPRLVWGKAFKMPSLPHAPIPAQNRKLLDSCE